MMYITSKVTGEKKATITMATEKRLQELMNREHQSNEAKFLAWALEEYKCECGCGGASIKEIRKYAEQEDWLRDEFGFDTEGYMEDTARAMNNRFHDYMAYWCRFCHSSLSIKSFNKLVKAVYDMTDEYGYVIYPEEVEEEPSATAETVESVEETTVSETVEETAEQEETEVKTKMYWAAVRNKETNQLEVIKRDDYSSKKDFAHDLRANGYAVRFISTPDKFDEDCENYYWECEKRQNVRKCVSESKERMETAEQETELNAEIAEVEAEQTAEPETFSKSKSESESEPTDDSNTVETYQDNINVLIVVDIANTFETITHTGYFDTS